MLVGVRKGLIGNTPTIPHSPATILCSDAMSEPNQPNPQQRPRRRIRINVSVVWSTVIAPIIVSAGQARGWW